MPGWFIHMEAARLAAQRLQAGSVPAELGLDPAEAQRLGDLAYKWRNYLAVGAVGPDMFYLLPDFRDPYGGPLFSVASWIFDVWTTIEDKFLGPWNKWMGPIGANDAELAAQLTGGLSKQIGQALDDVAGTIGKGMLTLLTRSTDIFGQLSSGPPQGFPERAFFWSDMLHYRRTYEVPRVLYRLSREAELAATTDDERADAEAGQAFALGWLSHCATDVVGHAFTNAKSGGPFRLHWQRHHLVENHFDSRSYDGRYGAGTHYRTIGTSGLHFRIAWRRRMDAPYNGRRDAPMYDYFAGLPPYELGTNAVQETARRQHFSVAPADLPEHLVRLLGQAFREVYGPPDDITPKVIARAAPEFSDDGRPNGDAMQVMWEIVFRFLAHTSVSGLGLDPPSPPPLINDHPFPSPPGSLAPGDESRGADLSDDDVTILDILIALFAWVIFIAQIVVWVITILPGLVLDVLTFPTRAVLHYTIVAPLHSLYLASRRVLVLSGFLTPETREIDIGLVTLGRSSTFWRASLRADIADPVGFAPLPTGHDEPSGRTDSGQARHADPAYPRDTPRDPMPVLSQILAAAGADPSIPSAGFDDPYSEWVFPWRYPERDVQGHRIGWEALPVHAGPFLLGDTAEILLTDRPTDVHVAAQYEGAPNPGETEEISANRLPQDRHLGHPVDYTLYLVSRLVADDPVPSFNLDSDRGYAWKCWDWSRHQPAVDPLTNTDWWFTNPFDEDSSEFDTQQPCTPPAQFDAYTVRKHQPKPPANELDAHKFNPWEVRLTRYLDAGSDPATCGNDVQASIPQFWIDLAGLPPDGEP